MIKEIYVNNELADTIARGVVREVINGTRIAYYSDIFTNECITKLIREMIISEYEDKETLYDTIYTIVLDDVKGRKINIYILFALFDNAKWYETIKYLIDKYVYQYKHMFKKYIKNINNIIDNYNTMDNELARAIIEYINIKIEESDE